MRRKLQIWSHLEKKSLMENLIFCAMRWTKFKTTANAFFNLQRIIAIFILNYSFRNENKMNVRLFFRFFYHFQVVCNFRIIITEEIMLNIFVFWDTSTETWIMPFLRYIMYRYIIMSCLSHKLQWGFKKELPNALKYGERYSRMDQIKFMEGSV